MLPEPGTDLEFQFFLMDAIITFAFTIELLVNMFVHSDNCLKPFFSRPAKYEITRALKSRAITMPQYHTAIVSFV